MSKTKLSEVGKAVRRFRRRHKRQWLPASLWEKVSQLQEQHELGEISKATGITRSALKRRFGKSSAFFEVKADQVMPAKSPSRAAVVEVKRADGTAMTARVGSEAELKALLGAFVGS